MMTEIELEPEQADGHVTEQEAAGTPPRSEEAGAQRPGAVVAAAVVAVIAAAGAITSSLPIWLGGGIFALGILQASSVGYLDSGICSSRRSRLRSARD